MGRERSRTRDRPAPRPIGAGDRWWSGPLREDGLHVAGEGLLETAGRAMAGVPRLLARVRRGVLPLVAEARRLLRTRPEVRLGAFVVTAGLVGGVLAWTGLVLLWSALRALFA